MLRHAALQFQALGSVLVLSAPCAAQAQGVAAANQPAGTVPSAGQPGTQPGTTPPPIVVIGRRAPAPACGSDRVACFDQQLKIVARSAQTNVDPRAAASTATSPALRVGVGSVQASSQRLGGDLRGASSLPQRPLPFVYPPSRSHP